MSGSTFKIFASHGNPVLLFKQIAIILIQMLVKLQINGGNYFSGFADYCLIILINHMQNNIIIGFIGTMPVAEPIG